MTNEQIKKAIHQVLYNPQVSYPPTSYAITEKGGIAQDEYSSEYMDIEDFKSYLKRLEEQLISRLVTKE